MACRRCRSRVIRGDGGLGFAGCRDEVKGDGVDGAAFVRCATRDDEHVAFVEGEPGCAGGGRREPFNGQLVVVGALGCATELVHSRAFEDLEDVVAAFVPLELFGGLLLFGGEDDGEGEFGGLEEVVVAGRGLELLHGVGELVCGEELEGNGLGWRRGGLREQRCFGESEACGCGEGSCAKEAAARGLGDRFAHEEVKHICRGVCQWSSRRRRSEADDEWMVMAILRTQV
jgi:hypothetical protein